LSDNRSASDCDTTNATANTNAAGSLSNPTIDAAILAVDHSFMVDNFDCAAPLGNLTIWGAIAQNFRGYVGTHQGNAVQSGYTKNYNYDTRLRSLSPPYFLNPVSAGWQVIRVTECDASGSC
jgi:hypothetical protein